MSLKSIPPQLPVIMVGLGHRYPSARVGKRGERLENEAKVDVTVSLDHPILRHSHVSIVQLAAAIFEQPRLT